MEIQPKGNPAPAGFFRMPSTKIPKKVKVKTPTEFENLGSLITYKEGEQDCCLGYLVNFKEHGVFDASFGRVDIAVEHVDPHNQALDKATIEGLDERCEIGQGGSFYVRMPNKGSTQGSQIRTFCGAVIADNVQFSKNPTGAKHVLVSFRRNGKLFRGTWKTDTDLFNFRRVS